ncbi:MAG: ester cyclase [Hyphomicrobiales bacterium]
MTPERLIAPLYDALNEPGKKDVTALLEGCLSADWKSWGSAGSVSDRGHFIAKVKGLGAVIPDLAFAIQEVIAAGDKIVVRSEATGTPVKDFMGVPVNGKSFRITTIDIHTVRDGKSVAVHHVEDWMAAVMQLRG